MKHGLCLVILLLSSAACFNEARGQITNRTAVYVSGLGGVPLLPDVFREDWYPGFGGAVEVGMRFRERTEFMAEGSFLQFDMDAPSGNQGGTFRIYGGGLGVRQHGPPGRHSFFVSLRGLLRHVSLSQSTSGGLTTAGTRVTRPAINFGLAGRTALSERAFAFAEVGYELIFTERSTTDYVPLRVGVAFGLNR